MQIPSMLCVPRNSKTEANAEILSGQYAHVDMLHMQGKPMIEEASLQCFRAWATSTAEKKTMCSGLRRDDHRKM